MRRMIHFLAGDQERASPSGGAALYAHEAYDRPRESQVIRQPDVLIFEGLNVLAIAGAQPVLASDFFRLLGLSRRRRGRYRGVVPERFLLLHKTAFRDEKAFFNRYKDLSREEAIAFATMSGARSTCPICAKTSCRRAKRASVVPYQAAGSYAGRGPAAADVTLFDLSECVGLRRLNHLTVSDCTSVRWRRSN